MSKISNVKRIDYSTLSDDNLFVEGPKWENPRDPSENHQIYYMHDGVTPFTDEEIEAANAKEMEETKAGLEVVKADGFIPFPIFFHDVDGEFVEREAWIHPEFEPSNSEGFVEKHGMNYNIYIPSYGREDELATTKMLLEFNVDNWYLAVDPSQYVAYRDSLAKLGISNRHIIIRDIYFRDEKMVDLTTSIKTPNYTHGTAGIYNFLLAFSRSIGERKFWTSDDDIIGLAMKAYKGDEMMKAGEKYDKNNFYRCSKIVEDYGFDYKKFMKSLEDVSDKARNNGFVALEKFGLVFALPIFWKLGTRAYSYYLTDNATQINHIGALNNDVTTSLEMSKRGYVNMLFEGICYNSLPTQMSGGLTEQYRRFGTLEKGKRLVKVAPHCARIVDRYSRIHHIVDYNWYNKQRLVGRAIPQDQDE